MAKRKSLTHKKISKRFQVTELRRRLIPIKVTKDQILDDPNAFIHDPVFHDLYTQLLLGKRNAALTRISLARIQPLFLDYSHKPPKVIEEPISTDKVRFLISNIRAGMRSPLFLYKSRKSSKYDFFCSDDANLYSAYEHLGVTKVPVVLLDYDINDLEDSALCIYYPNYKDPQFTINHLQPLDRENGKVESFFGIAAKYEITELTSKLEKIIEETLDRVRTFHIEIGGQVHYHHTLASILFRLKQSIHAIGLLARENLTDQIIIQLRSIYELSLNFYIDWLAPESIGPYAQLFSITSRRDWVDMRKKHYEEKRLEGWNESQIKILTQGDNLLYDLLTKVSEKAKLNPLASKHNDIYGFLSRFAHQDFYITARHAHILKSPGELKEEPKFIKYITLYMDIIVAEIIYRINSDTGIAEHQMKR